MALIGEELWRSAFGGDRDVLGRTVTLDGEVWSVVGVMPRRTILPNGIPTRIDLWRPLPETEEGTVRSRHLVARLREGVTTDQVNERLAVLESALAEEGRVDVRHPGLARPVTELLGGSLRDTLEVLMAAVLFLLLISAVNVANLLLARAAVRGRETAVRSALGATRIRLARQLLLESLLLALLGGLLGIGLAYGAVAAIPHVRPGNLEVLEWVRLDGRVLLFGLGTATLTGLAFGVLPAWRGTSAGALESLRSGARTDGGGVPGRRMRWALVAAEVSLSFALLAGSGLLLGSLARMQRRDPGFRAAGLLVADVRLPSWKYGEATERSAVLDRIGERLRSLGGVRGVAEASGLPPRAGILFGQVRVEGEAPTEETHVFHGPGVGVDYFRVLEQRIVEGRGFTPEEIRDGAAVYVIGEEAARRFFPGRSAVGARMSVGDADGEPATVVGVARDVAVQGLASADSYLQIYWPFPSDGSPGGRTFLIRTEDDAASTARLVREVVLGEEPDALVEGLVTAESLFAHTLGRERFATLLLALFAGLALVLSAIGLYGVVAQVAGQRRREIGVRVSLGARAADIRRMIVGSGLRATLAGVLLGGVLTAGGTRLLSSRIFGLDEVRTGTYLAAALVLGITALLASWLPARRAARTDPVEALRSE